MIVSPGDAFYGPHDLKLKAAQPAAKPYHLTDGHGLFVVVQQNGSKLRRWKYRFQGEYRLMAFGSYPLRGCPSCTRRSTRPVIPWN